MIGQLDNGLLTRITLALTLVVTSSYSIAQSSVWKVENDSQVLYLGGTVHLLRASDYPLPDPYDQAYAESSTLVFETDLSSMSDMSVQASLLQQLSYSDGRSLKTVLSDEAYSVLENYTAGVGLPLPMLEKFKPGMIVSTLQLMEFQKMGFTPQGVDAHFNSRAIADGKTLGQLETVEAQIGFLAAMGEGNESEFILLSLADLSETAEIMDDMIEAWRIGDNGALEDLFVKDMIEQAPAVYESLLKQRNFDWLPQIEMMLSNDNVEFVLVGAAHLVGPHGLLNLLENEGYSVQQL